MIGRRILVVDDDDSLRRVLEVQLQQAGYRVGTAKNGAEALARLRDDSYDLVLADLRMPGMSGLELLREIQALRSEVVVIILTAYGAVDTAVEAMRSGAYHYLTKPVYPDVLALTIHRALEHLTLLEEVRNLRESLDGKYGFENIAGHSEALLSVLDLAARAARTSSIVLIQGETGTGKELLAKAIHFNSERRDKAFVTINCGAIPKELLESELFGHQKGSFTGAVAHKKGKIEIADGGTVFLDEIAEMPLELQVKLLRVIQYGELEKVGAVEPTRVDVRILAATHRNLRARIEDGAFREDLYYRLAVIPIVMPPLRERIGDIPELVRYFFEACKRKHARTDLVLPDALMAFFSRYHWPGNVRELENVVERIVVLSRGPQITLLDLPDFLRAERPVVEQLNLDLPAQGISLESVERELILRALIRFDWNQTHAAQYLDISRKALIYRMEKHRIER